MFGFNPIEMAMPGYVDLSGLISPHFPVGQVSSSLIGPNPSVRAGYETNELDVRSDLNPGNRNGVIAPTPDPDRWKEVWRDQDLNRGYSQDPSRPGNLHPDPVSNPSPMGSAVNQTRPGFSAPSPSGYAGRGGYDEEGPAGSSSGAKAANDAAQWASQSQSPSRSHNQDYNRDRQESYADKYSGSGGGGGDAGKAGSDVSNKYTSTSKNEYGYEKTTTTTTYKSGVSQTTTNQTINTPAGPKAVTKTTTTPAPDRTATENRRPILLDLNNNGIQITEFDRSTIFMDGNNGLQHRTAWAGAGDGVLFYDPDGRNAITEKRQYVFTEWNPTASGDLEALRSVWDSNGDVKLTAADAEFAKFKVMVTNANGSTTVMTLAALGITEINLTADTTQITLPDGSQITGQTTFTRGNDLAGFGSGVRANRRRGAESGGLAREVLVNEWYDSTELGR